MTTEIHFFALKSKKKKVLERGQNGFKYEDNNNNNDKRHLIFSFVLYIYVFMELVSTVIIYL